MSTLPRTDAVSPVPTRAIPTALAELDHAVGEHETALRSLAGRLSLVLPGGIPGNNGGKDATSQPKSVVSEVTDKIKTNTAILRALTSQVEALTSVIEV
jgi:hypothetical protein